MSSSSDPSPAATPNVGERLAGQEQRLRLLFHHLAGRAVRARIEADDLVQEVFLRVVTASGGLPPWERGEGPLWRFLAHLARNTVVDAARSIRAAKRSGREVALTRSDWSRAGPRASQLLAETAGPATRAVASETTQRLLARFQNLSPEHRRVIGLRQFEGLGARETARRMGRSESAIHSLYRRALAMWHQGLERSPDSGDESPAP